MVFFIRTSYWVMSWTNFGKWLQNRWNRNKLILILITRSLRKENTSFQGSNWGAIHGRCSTWSLGHFQIKLIKCLLKSLTHFYYFLDKCTPVSFVPTTLCSSWNKLGLLKETQNYNWWPIFVKFTTRSTKDLESLSIPAKIS